MAFRTDRVRLAILLKRKASLSKEEFHKYWAEKHGPLFSSVDIVKTNLLKYEQAHTNEGVNQQVAQMMGIPMPEWDGIAIFEGESYAKIFEVFQNEEYKRVIIPDEEKFIDRQGCQMIPLDLLSVIDK
ncbi:EthD domain-containing protein [Mycena capillaripes]|nr:EthD domain-containing protein [Mycena capillaripes]